MRAVSVDDMRAEANLLDTLIADLEQNPPRPDAFHKAVLVADEDDSSDASVDNLVDTVRGLGGVSSVGAPEPAGCNSRF